MVRSHELICVNRHTCLLSLKEFFGRNAVLFKSKNMRKGYSIPVFSQVPHPAKMWARGRRWKRANWARSCPAGWTASLLSLPVDRSTSALAAARREPGGELRGARVTLTKTRSVCITATWTSSGSTHQSKSLLTALCIAAALYLHWGDLSMLFRAVHGIAALIRCLHQVSLVVSLFFCCGMIPCAEKESPEASVKWTQDLREAVLLNEPGFSLIYQYHLWLCEQ